MPECVAPGAGGAKGLLEAGYRPGSGSDTDSRSNSSSSAASASESETSAAPGSSRAGGEGGAAQPLWRRQYVFVAATMPQEGGSTVGSTIERHFPSAVWLAGRRLHQPQAKVSAGQGQSLCWGS